MMIKHKDFHINIKNVYGEKGYGLFKQMLEYICNMSFEYERKEAVRMAEFKEKNNVSNKKNMRRLQNGIHLDLDTSVETFMKGAPEFTNYGL